MRLKHVAKALGGSSQRIWLDKRRRANALIAERPAADVAVIETKEGGWNLELRSGRPIEPATLLADASVLEQVQAAANVPLEAERISTHDGTLHLAFGDTHLTREALEPLVHALEAHATTPDRTCPRCGADDAWVLLSADHHLDRACPTCLGVVEEEDEPPEAPIDDVPVPASGLESFRSLGRTALRVAGLVFLVGIVGWGAAGMPAISLGSGTVGMRLLLAGVFGAVLVLRPVFRRLLGAES